MNRAWSLVPWVVLGVLGAVAFREHGMAQAREKGLRGQITLWQNRVAEAESQRRVDSVQVVRTVTQTRTLRDTLLEHLTDTVAVKEYIYHTDTLRTACERCVASAARLSVANVGLQATNDSLLAIRRPPRCGLSAGYGGVARRDGFFAGPVIAASCRVWP